MFRWYRNAVRCYVYLADVPWSEDRAIWTQRLRDSRWFTRGWTLQELIAPRGDVVFYSAEWRKLATKTEIYELLVDITGIDESVLKGGELSNVSIARKMSWAAHRKTSRVEDMAYSLLGIFDINLPLIYGEGKKAFRRLQEAIMITSSDQSLFAWGKLAEKPSDLIDMDQFWGVKPIPWKPPELRGPRLGLFAESPADFVGSKDIVPLNHWMIHEVTRQRPAATVNGGVLINLIARTGMWPGVDYFDCPVVVSATACEALLLCRVGTTGQKVVALALCQWGHSYFARTREFYTVEFTPNITNLGLSRTIHILAPRNLVINDGSIVFRRLVLPPAYVGNGSMPTPSGAAAWTISHGHRVCQLAQDAAGTESFTYVISSKKGSGFGIFFRRCEMKSCSGGLGRLMIEVVKVDGKDTVDFINSALHYAEYEIGPHGTGFQFLVGTPEDHCATEFDGFAIYIKVERVSLDSSAKEGDKIDLVDFFIFEPGDPEQGNVDPLFKERSEDQSALHPRSAFEAEEVTRSPSDLPQSISQQHRDESTSEMGRVVNSLVREVKANVVTSRRRPRQAYSCKSCVRLFSSRDKFFQHLRESRHRGTYRRKCEGEPGNIVEISHADHRSIQY